MNRTNHHFAQILIVFGLLMASIAAPTALGQSDREIRDENQVLQSQVRGLQAQLDAAMARITELEAAKAKITQLEQENAALKGMLRSQQASSGATPPPPPEKVTIDESIANASPRALFNAMSDDFRQSMGDMSVGDEDTRDGRHDRDIYLDVLDRWINAANRQYRSQIQWHVALEENARLPRTGNDLRVRAVDPVTGTQLGPSFELSLPRFQMDRLREAQESGQLEVMELRGVVEPRVVRNMAMEHAGPFDQTQQRRIAPFAEFGYSVRVKSVQPIAARLATETPPANPPGK